MDRSAFGLVLEVSDRDDDVKDQGPNRHNLPTILVSILGDGTSRKRPQTPGDLPPLAITTRRT